ncbi:acetolactate synthase small subunit [Streptomyces sp. NPDC002928]|uniref:acetolactate synthase small subunit n=1 Tax=Streptomyces sp. NPDC002928 TaxID=3154440 RepID=UPI0033B4C0B8
MRKQTLSLMVENRPGVLAKVAGVFGPRGWNIVSLAVGESGHPDVSWMTVVASIGDASPASVTEELVRLPHVLNVVELAPEPPVRRGCLW